MFGNSLCGCVIASRCTSRTHNNSRSFSCSLAVNCEASQCCIKLCELVVHPQENVRVRVDQIRSEITVSQILKGYEGCHPM